MNILVAEDSLAFRQLYKKALEARGHKVTLAEDGARCMYQFIDAADNLADKDKNPFDVVVLDYDIPRKNGLQVAKEIVDMKPRQRIVFITAFSDKFLEQLRVLKTHSKFELLEKPFDLATMVRQVEGLATFKWNNKVHQGFANWNNDRGLSEAV
jgi:two-component system cell cycle response regulator CpdR